MAKSVRISNPLFEHATLESTLMHRSIALQIEHWCALGRALEASGMSMGELRATLQEPMKSKPLPSAAHTAPEARMWAEKRQRQRRDRAALARGEILPESMTLIPRRLARTASVRFKDADFVD